MTDTLYNNDNSFLDICYCLFDWVFSPQSRLFYSFRDVTMAIKGLGTYGECYTHIETSTLPVKDYKF